MSTVHKVTPERCSPAPGSIIVNFSQYPSQDYCEATLDWYVGSKTCDDDSSRVESMTFTFPPDATDGTMSACVVTNGAGSDEECSVGGQACSRAIQYHEFLPDQTPWHIHEYCACN